MSRLGLSASRGASGDLEQIEVVNDDQDDMPGRQNSAAVGMRHHHREIRTFALDAFREESGCVGDKFEYPADYRPEHLTEGAFGLIRGEPTKVRILFDPKVARYVVLWQPNAEVQADGVGPGDHDGGARDG